MVILIIYEILTHIGKPQLEYNDLSSYPNPGKRWALQSSWFGRKSMLFSLGSARHMPVILPFTGRQCSQSNFVLFQPDDTIPQSAKAHLFAPSFLLLEYSPT